MEHMVLGQDTGVSMDRPKVWDDAMEAVVRNGYAPKVVKEIGCTKLYEKTGEAYVTVRTNEYQPYGCFILQKGVSQALRQYRAGMTRPIRAKYPYARRLQRKGLASGTTKGLLFIREGGSKL